MLTVDSFLCFKLETGGRIFGWFGVIGSGLVISFLILAMVMVSMLSCEQINLIDEEYAAEFTMQLGLYDCRSLYGAFIIICSILVATYMFAFVIYFLLLRGISNQNHKKILPALIFEAIGMISVVFLKLLQQTIQGFIEAIILGIIYFYIFTVLYSLYAKIKNGNRRGVASVQFKKEPNV